MTVPGCSMAASVASSSQRNLRIVEKKDEPLPQAQHVLDGLAKGAPFERALLSPVG